MREVAVVIVNFNAGPLLGDGIARVRAARGARHWDLVVVDNASTDDSLASLQGASDVRLIRNADNRGFGAACNQGALAATAPWLLFLNPDCALAAGVVEHLAAVADADPTCVGVGPRIDDPDGAPQGSARGDPDLLAGVAGRTSWLARVLPGSAVVARHVVWPERVPAGTPSIAVDWVSGACLLVRRTAFEAVAGFDPGYFMYWEDADLCRRLRQQGGSVRYAPGVRVRHVVGHSSRRAPELAVRAFHASAYRYYARWNAPNRWDPRRLVARSLLAVRLRIKLAKAR